MPDDLVERGAAVEALDGCLQTVREGSGQIVLVCGEAGIGKTSLLRQFASQHPRVPLWWGACDALQTPHPLAPLLDIARENHPRFAAQLAGPRPALFEAVLDELRLAATPVLVVIEDAHWADDATLDLLKFLGRRIARTKALLAISYRDDEVTGSHPLRRVIGELPTNALLRVLLPRLSPQAVEAMAQRAARPAAGVHAATQGNPFFVTELLRDSGGSGAVPSTVQDVVLARCARLTEPALALLHLAAVVPGRIERWLVDELVAPPIAVIEACIASGLLVANEDSFSFRHELARVAVESSLSPPRAQALHAGVLGALAIESRHTAPARLVHHALRSRERAAISRFAPAAAEQARGRGAHREATAHWRNALQHGDPADDAQRRQWLEQFAIATNLTGLTRESLQARCTLEQMASARGDIVDAAVQLSRQAMAHIALMRHDEADRLNHQALAMLEPLPAGPAHGTVWSVEAYLRMLNRDCEDSVVWARRTAALAESIGDTVVASAAQSALGTALLFIDYEQGVDQMLQTLARQRAAGNLQAAGGTLSNLGSGSGELMQLDNAERWLREAIALCTAHEFDGLAHYSKSWLALTSLLRGRWDDAATLGREVAGNAAASDMSRLMALLALTRLRLRRGDRGADAALEEALALTGEHNTLQRIAPLRAARSEAAAARGDNAAIAAEVNAALPLAIAHRHPWFIGELAYWGWCAGTLGEPPDGCAEPYALEISGRWREAAAAWQRAGCPYERARALAKGDADAQREALAVFELLGARPAADALRRRLREAGVRGIARGARAATREHAYGLTGRELQVLHLLCEGLRNAEIAVRLSRSVRTVDHHLAAVFAKLGVDSRIAAIQAAQRAGLASQSGQAPTPK